MNRADQEAFAGGQNLSPNLTIGVIFDPAPPVPCHLFLSLLNILSSSYCHLDKRTFCLSHLQRLELSRAHADIHRVFIHQPCLYPPIRHAYSSPSILLPKKWLFLANPHLCGKCRGLYAEHLKRREIKDANRQLSLNGLKLPTFSSG